MKRWLCFWLTAVLLLSLCACARETGTTKSEDPLSIGGDTDYAVKRDALYPLPPGYLLRGAVRQGQTLMLAGEKGGSLLLGLTDYSIGEDGAVSLSELRSFIPDDPESLDEKNFKALCAGGDGYFYVLTGEDPGEYRDESSGTMLPAPDYKGRYCLLCYDTEGRLLDRVRLSGWPYPDISHLLVDAQGSIFLAGEENVSVIDRDGKLLFDTCLRDEEDEWRRTRLLSASLTARGPVFCVFNGQNGMAAEYCLLDGKGGVWQSLGLESPPDSFPGMGCYGDCQGLDGELLINDTQNFCAYDLDSGECRTLMNWAEGSGGSYRTVCRVGEGCFLAVGGLDNMLDVYRMIAIPRDGRETVRIALVNNYFGGWSVDSMEKRARRFYQANPSYRCEFEYYTDREADRLRAAIGAGGGPDLVLFSGYYFNAGGALFADLYPFLDADPELSREDFLPNLLSSLETQGELRQIWSGVTINALAVRDEDLRGGQPPSLDACRAILAENPDRRFLFEYTVNQSWMLQNVAALGSAYFFDRESGACRYDSESFLELLRLCLEMPDTVDPDPDNYYYAVIYAESLTSAGRLPAIERNIGPYRFVGWPVDEGSGIYYSPYWDHGMAIPKASRCPDGAWAYIRSELSLQRQIALAESSIAGFPVRAEALDRCLDLVSGEKLNSAYRYKLLKLTESADRAVLPADNQLRELIVECGQAMLNGDRTPEETAALIQHRAGIYLAEQLG